SSATYAASEDAGTATITAVLNVTSTQAVTVSYTSGDGTATAPADYTAASGTFTFVPNDDTETFTVFINDDGFNELDETVALTLTAASANASLGITDTATLTILDNDAVSVTFSSAIYSADESVGLAFITITLNTTSTQWITAAFTTGDGTAIAPDDYAANSGTRTFLPGNDTMTFPVIINDDGFNELDETVAL
ncbi:MAG: Calx-beta domain-containing protein, partial [Desulfobacterales bacterium]|nr:Calx-beta domain-containing protein [Desulfobacterales bacterium]